MANTVSIIGKNIKTLNNKAICLALQKDVVCVLRGAGKVLNRTQIEHDNNITLFEKHTEFKTHDGVYRSGNSIVYPEPGNIKTQSPFIVHDVMGNSTYKNTERLHKDLNNLDYKVVIEKVCDLITIVSERGIIIFASPSWKRLLGYASEELVGNNIFQKIIHPDDRKITVNYLLQLHSKVSMSLSIRFKHKKGYWMYMEVSGSTVEDGKKTSKILVLVSHDITERITQAERKDAFIDMASHELKTPLTSMKMYLEIFKNKLKEKQNRDALNFANKITEQTDKLIELVNELLDVSNIESGQLVLHKEKIDINKILRELVKSVQTITKKHTIVFKEMDVLSVYGDNYRLYQVFMNLLMNALKYSPHGGDIIITLKKDLKNVIISVQDFGIGISKANHEKIFEKLYQVPDARTCTFPGLGMGLFISKEIVSRHKGKISVKSRKNGGSIFSVSLPL